MVENHLAKEIELLEEIKVLNERVDNVVSRVNAYDIKLAQHDELLRKNKLLWAQFRARRVRRKSLLPQEVDNAAHCDQLDNLGLIPLSESQLQDIRAKQSSCVRFIGCLVQASFPNGYFNTRMPEHVTKAQFKRLYEITCAYFTKIKRARRNAVKLSLKEVTNVIRTYIYNTRNRHKGRFSSSSTESEYSTAEFSCDDLPINSESCNNASNTHGANVSNGSASNDDGFNENDTDNDYCDRPCDPPNHYPNCKNFTGVVHVYGKYQLDEGTERARLRQPKAKQYHPKFAIVPDASEYNQKQPKYLQSEGKTNGSAGFYQCDVCDKKFSRKNAVARHKLIHTDPITWSKCPFCEYRASDISNLRKHSSQSHKEEKPNRLTCDICHKKLANTRNLNRHKLTIHHS
ncbi:uncharacterized protein LOC130703376 isoform X2 [Daphnia carinata]|uniref:uncharacterized protein LOC130703376 isoform X2 n=1 Tax=Daphnia carinata TaxID=120202 RepID=UPI00257D142C|nr:uncharacterized protein LOC130703376 isoform X2 [Daphnia carinata]